MSSKVNAVVWAEDSVDVNNLDIICFGHLLYEMCTGYELSSPQPTLEKILHDLDRFPQVNTIELFVHLVAIYSMPRNNLANGYKYNCHAIDGNNLVRVQY